MAYAKSTLSAEAARTAKVKDPVTQFALAEAKRIWNRRHIAQIWLSVEVVGIFLIRQCVRVSTHINLFKFDNSVV